MVGQRSSGCKASLFLAASFLPFDHVESDFWITPAEPARECGTIVIVEDSGEILGSLLKRQFSGQLEDLPHGKVAGGREGDPPRRGSQGPGSSCGHSSPGIRATSSHFLSAILRRRSLHEQDRVLRHKELLSVELKD